MSLSPPPRTQPNPYIKGNLDTLDVIRAKLDPEGFEGYCFGMVHKRLHRAASVHRDIPELKRRDYAIAAWYLTQMMRDNRLVGQVPLDGLNGMTEAFDGLALRSPAPRQALPATPQGQGQTIGQPGGIGAHPPFAGGAAGTGDRDRTLTR